MREIRYRGADIRGRPTEFDGDRRYPVEIMLTTRLAELSGRVVDERGSLVPGAGVACFSTDERLWDAGPFVRAHTRQDGTFRRAELLPGKYLSSSRFQRRTCRSSTRRLAARGSSSSSASLVSPIGSPFSTTIDARWT